MTNHAEGSEERTCEATEEAAFRVTMAYRRALWTVVLLNAGFGAVEIGAGFLARSQSLKADALDFVGDGVITGIGLLVANSGAKIRARSALGQGLFLGTLGFGVLASTLYRLLFIARPEADVMGAVGLVALLVNLAAAAVLIPHRNGDAGVRAVWLFSRNDAIGNLVVVVAAGLVSLTKAPWPDLAAAGVVASLFLSSSWGIVKDARKELRRL